LLVKVRPLDVVVAVALTAVACTDVRSETAANVPLALAAIVASGLTLVVHRQLPWLPAMALLVTSWVLGATTPGEWGPQTLVLAVTYAVYLLAVRVEGLYVWLAGAATLALEIAAHAATPDGDLYDFWPFLVWAFPWAAGRAVRRVSTSAARSVDAAERERDRAAEEAVTAERDRIARELHDVVAHAVSVMVVRAGGQRLRMAERDPEAAEAFGDIEQAGREALTDLRAMLRVLRDAESVSGVEEPMPDTAAIAALVERVRRTGHDVRMDHFDPPDDLPGGVGLAAYRIVQEGLTNAVRHGAGPIDLAITREPGALRIRLTNPVGARKESVGAGRGLAGMSERIRLLDGSLVAEHQGDAWCIDATLPVPA
jgi:signal transduction histidine kinase